MIRDGEIEKEPGEELLEEMSSVAIPSPLTITIYPGQVVVGQCLTPFAAFSIWPFQGSRWQWK
jgi:hypothetical protein